MKTFLGASCANVSFCSSFARHVTSISFNVDTFNSINIILAGIMNSLENERIEMKMILNDHATQRAHLSNPLMHLLHFIVSSCCGRSSELVCMCNKYSHLKFCFRVTLRLASKYFHLNGFFYSRRQQKSFYEMVDAS